MIFKEYTTANGALLLYTGAPNLNVLEQLASGYGDIWHSSFEQGYKNAFQDLAIQSSVLFWYINDFEGLNECVSWRINSNHFAIRKSVWETLGGFDADYENIQMQALDFGYNALRNQGVVPLYVSQLFTETLTESIQISARDRYVFFIKNFKIDHALFMLYRKGLWKYSEWKAFLNAKNNFSQVRNRPLLPPRKLKSISGNPTVSYIIPTMLRQDFTLRLLEDLSGQSYLPTQVVIVDATPENVRDEALYKAKNYPFELTVNWQTTKGSCRARNEAIALCTSEYIVFGDDDIRIPPNFIESHIQLLQTYNAAACNGLDIMADHPEQDLNDLKSKLDAIEKSRWFVGSTQMFSNANSCVKRAYVNQVGGNDINYDGGYGEDGDFGIALLKLGIPVLHNPFATNLHLKPMSGGYRFWGSQAKILGKKRKQQPWELDTPVKWIRPVPSPTLMYQFCKHFTPKQVKEFKHKYFFLFLVNGSKWTFIYRVLRIPYKRLQFKKSQFYAKKLLQLGVRTR
ncbi:glycosyltransferase [Flavobacterium sp.]|uniref:glycosyltransferase family 2 protein n=1 Tax=Flavobacterium sp. TaxID=239 RepID=UPI00286C04F2|nr:glycosyltransferase [Flavobacterium sp.]